MEQRKGRIHRYKGHAVRKNLAQQFQTTGRATSGSDRWNVMFEQAKREQSGNGRGLVPEWNYPTEDGARIERHVPMLPFSREARKYERLCRSLAAYRMVFGQARQQDLVAYLLSIWAALRLRGLRGG